MPVCAGETEERGFIRHTESCGRYNFHADNFTQNPRELAENVSLFVVANATQWSVLSFLT